MKHLIIFPFLSRKRTILFSEVYVIFRNTTTFVSWEISAAESVSRAILSRIILSRPYLNSADKFATVEYLRLLSTYIPARCRVP